MQYGVIKSEGKWWVMEYLGKPPIEEKITDENKWFRYISNYKDAVTSRLPTLPEHSDYWAKLEGKVIEEKEFEKKDFFVKGSYHNTCSICKKEFSGTDKFWFLCQNHSAYVIPKQESQEDLWENAFAEAALEANNVIGFKSYLKKHFTITRK